jgi:hypothetical protein
MRLHVPRRHVVDRFTIRLHEAQRAIIQHLNADTALVDAAMMKPAEQRKITRLRLAAIRPMLHMVGIEPLCVCTTGKTAPFVARVENAT